MPWTRNCYESLLRRPTRRQSLEEGESKVESCFIPLGPMAYGFKWCRIWGKQILAPLITHRHPRRPCHFKRIQFEVFPEPLEASLNILLLKYLLAVLAVIPSWQQTYSTIWDPSPREEIKFASKASTRFYAIQRNQTRNNQTTHRSSVIIHKDSWRRLRPTTSSIRHEGLPASCWKEAIQLLAWCPSLSFNQLRALLQLPFTPITKWPKRGNDLDFFFLKSKLLTLLCPKLNIVSFRHTPPCHTQQEGAEGNPRANGKRLYPGYERNRSWEKVDSRGREGSYLKLSEARVLYLCSLSSP